MGEQEERKTKESTREHKCGLPGFCGNAKLERKHMNWRNPGEGKD